VESIARVAAGDFAEICVLATSEKANGAPPALWSAYGRLDRWMFGGADPLKPNRVDLLVAPELRVPLAPGDAGWRNRMAALDLDVAITLGDLDESGLADLARYGAWRFAFGDAQAADPRVAALREVIGGEPVVSAALRIRRGAASRIACRSYSRTIPFSIARSHDRIFGKAGTYLERSLRRLRDEGDGWLDRQETLGEVPHATASLGVGESLRGIASLGASVARRTVETCFTVGQWSLAFRFASHEPWTGSLEGFHRLVPPPDRFWADPFPLTVGERHFIFFEELPFSTGKGHICCVEVKRDGSAAEPIRVLERDDHLSYPFLIEHEGRLYMIPESSSVRTVEAWRCESFPGRWVRERVLLDDVFCADATVLQRGGRWWMFANAGSDSGGADDELQLFSSTSLFGEWRPHRANPVKGDVRGSRPAGRLFEEGGALYRPSQICAPLYGSGVALNRVTRLDDEAFAEEEVRRIEPAARGEGLLGIHTLNRAGDLSVIDAFARRRRF
jgi:hypothetical protein